MRNRLKLPTLVQHYLEDHARRNPEKTALICDGVRLTYLQVDLMANRLANALIASGIQRGNRIAIHLPNSVSAVISIFAVLKAGGVFVVINPTTKQEKLFHILHNCRAAGLIIESRNHYILSSPQEINFLQVIIRCGDEFFNPVDDHLWSSRPVPSLDFNAVQNSYSGDHPYSKSIDLDLACLIYTSGSTGDPKGVMSDHGNIIFAASSIIQYLENVEDDIVINMLPLSFDYGLYQLLMTFQFGGTLVLERNFIYPAQILKRIEQERVTGFPGVPTIFSILLHMNLGSFDLSSVRYLTNTAAALPPNHISQLRDKFPWAKLYSMYGLTETKRTLYLPPDQLVSRPGSVGIAIPGTEVWIEDESGNRMKPGEVGELVVRGRHVMRGYWEDEAGSAERFRPSQVPGERLCYTGDLFRMDDAGFCYFVSRKDDIIKSRGEKVAPKEVENALLGIQGVLEAAVVGDPDPVLGQAIRAIVVTDGTQVTEKEVLAYCRAHLEDFMVPRHVEFRDELPKNASGKIQRSLL